MKKILLLMVLLLAGVVSVSAQDKMRKIKEFVKELASIMVDEKASGVLNDALYYTLLVDSWGYGEIESGLYEKRDCPYRVSIRNRPFFRNMVREVRIDGCESNETWAMIVGLQEFGFKHAEKESSSTLLKGKGLTAFAWGNKELIICY